MSDVPVFVINLARDTARRAHMQAQLAKLGLAAEFIPAVDGRSLTEADRRAYDRPKALCVYGIDMLDGEIACYLSHYRLYERIVRDNIPMALILEDDIEISPHLPAIIAELSAAPQPAWLVIRLEALKSTVREPRNARERGRNVQQLAHGAVHQLTTHTQGTGAYLISKPGAERMLNYGARIFATIDQTMDRFWENGIAPFIVRPLPTWQRPEFGSSIGVRQAGRHNAQPLAVRLQRKRQRVVDSIRKRVFTYRHCRFT